MVITIAEDMKQLTENILASSGVRLKAVGDLVTDTHKTLKDFTTDRKKMAGQQAKDLAGFVNGLAKDVQGLLKSAQGMVLQFHKNHGQMSKEQAKNLADYVNDLITGVGSMLDGFQENHAQMTKELKDKLSKEIKDIQTEVERILGEADELVGEFHSDMAGAKKAWKSMSATLAGPRKAGCMMPGVNFKKASTVKRATSGKSQGKKISAQKSGKKRVVSRV